MALMTNRLVFPIGHALSQGRPHTSLALPVDALIPFLPWTISIYFSCFAFWFAVYRLVAGLSREEADRFFCANLLSKGFCLLFFVFFPTAIERPVLGNSSIWEALVHFLYRFDTPDNLFPSVHCLIAWLCWVGIRRNRKISLPWRVSALVMALAVCISTLTLHQHVLADVFGGILLCEICWLIAGISALRNLYTRFADCLIQKLQALFPFPS